MVTADQASVSTSLSREHLGIGAYPSDSEESRRSSNSEKQDFSPLARLVRERRAEYTRKRTIRIKVGTWNVAALPDTEKDVGKWFVKEEGLCKKLAGTKLSEDLERLKKAESQFTDCRSTDNSSSANTTRDEAADDGAVPGVGEVGLYVLGLQEIVDVSSPAEALRPYVDPAPSTRWKEAVEDVLPEGYQLVSETQLVGLLLLIYASPSVVPMISSVSSTTVGTGLFGYMGNKGAVSTRLVLGETTCLIFINCHMAAGADKGSLERRNWDAGQIMGRTKFDHVNSDYNLRDDNCHRVGKEDFGFWFGDLNYRLEDIPGEDVRQVLARHTANEYDKTCEPISRLDGHKSDEYSDSASTGVQEETGQKSSRGPARVLCSRSSPLPEDEIGPHADPASLETTIASLLPHDQLRMQQQQGKAFHEGWREGDISFLPTYKYDPGSVALFDSSEKRRAPSWCDRILYRTRQDRLEYQQRIKDSSEAKKRDDEMKARGLDKAVADDNVLFEYDPATDGADGFSEYDPSADGASDHGPSEPRPAANETLCLEYYKSHQGILSSDHKPIDAGFRLRFDAVIPEMKAKVHQDVVRELDKIENEARPDVTIVVESPSDNQRQPREEMEETDPNVIDFGYVPFDFPVMRTLTVANTSSVPATFAFTEKSSFEEQPKSVTAPWLTVRIEGPVSDGSKEKQHLQSERHSLLPGEVADVEITLRIRDIHHVRMLNAGSLQLEEILVLQVKDGRDHFIPIHAKWLPTCFGRSIEDLTCIPETGARSLVSPEKRHEPKDGFTRLSAPRELYHLTESICELTERAVAEWSMTQNATDEENPPWAIVPAGFSWPFKPETWRLKDPDQRPHLLALVREALDTNRSLTGVFSPEIPSLHRLETLCETLLVFLRSLSDGIITPAMWHEMDRQIIAREKAKTLPRTSEEAQAWVLETFASYPAHSVSFTFVTFMLARIANEIAPSPPVPPAKTSTESSSSSSHSSTSPDGAGSGQQSQQSQQSSATNAAPASPAALIPGGGFRRGPRSLTASSASDTNSNSALARRQAVEAALSSLFADILVSSEVPVPSKEKDRRSWEERKRSIIEPFLKHAGVDGNGPSGGVK